MTYPLKVPAIRVKQPLGDFYAAVLPAHVLLDVTYSNALRVDEGDLSTGWYSVDGAQREFDKRRAKDIARYLEGTEAAFPNSIILGANYTAEGEHLGEESELVWRVAKDANTRQLMLTIPSATKLAAVIDGQHRIGGFKVAADSARKMDLLCAVYLDLPAPYQAYLFATINFNQKKVDKSLAYELFGFKLDSKQPDSWPPEKLAVFLCRRLNVEADSPFRQRIKVVAENHEALEGDESAIVSTATVVEGILALFSQRPKADRDTMALLSEADGRSRSQLESDKSPLRHLYLAGQDAVLYEVVKNYFKAVRKSLWDKAADASYIMRTVGVQAQFDLLKEICRPIVDSKNISEKGFEQSIAPLKSINFADEFFQASGKGRVRIKNAMRLKLKLVTMDDVSKDDAAGYRRVTS